MHMLTRRAGRLRLPARTVRMRLTMLYGGLFLVCGAGLLAVTYVLVSRADGGVHTYRGPDGVSGSVVDERDGAPATPPTTSHTSALHGAHPPADTPTPDQLRVLADHQHAAEMHQLLTMSGIALGIMAVLSIALGWIVAGRILRRLRTITAAAREISATNLHERLALADPADELKELGDTFDELLARLEAAFQAQRQFVANASHELRTPLARQRTLAQVALADPDATVASLRAAHERVLAAGAQQERLIEAMLTLARGQAGLDRQEPFDLAGLTDQVLAARRAEAAARGLSVHTALSPAATTGSPRLAERLVANLLDNALRHNTAQGWVDVGTETVDGHAVLSVTNTGPVVPEAALDQLFEPFTRIGSGRTANGDGLGLGLSIVRAIATAHGATIATRPRPGGGLTIELRFPSRPGSADTGDGAGACERHPLLVSQP